MPSFQSKSDVQAYFSVFNAGNIDLMVTYYSTAIKVHLGDVATISGREAVANHYRQQMLDMGEKMQVEKIVLGSEACVVKAEVHFIPKKNFGEGFLDLPPVHMGEILKVPFMIFYDLDEDQMVETVRAVPAGPPRVE
ncbi:hypothetical protein BKA66DRAFT_574560 [Pyrenochaeta sp. MPI-SDFR-AT-0127]|nr:hypothetical protein BKA66DRAFT_574560 [Pyrenochaeta sp. MPI-SDFR-AT-0127]